MDVGLLDNDDRLLAPIQHYRAATPELAQPLLDRLGAQELFTRTGVLPQHINTVFRIRQIVDSAGAAALSEGVRALLVPDLWCALLTGVPHSGAVHSQAGRASSPSEQTRGMSACWTPSVSTPQSSRPLWITALPSATLRKELR